MKPIIKKRGDKILILLVIVLAIFLSFFIINKKRNELPQETNKITIKEKQLTDLKENIVNFSWSPSNDKIVFESSNNIWTINSGGTDKKQLTDAASDIWHRNPSWSPNGKNIVYVSIITDNKPPISEIWLMDSDGGNKKQLMKHLGSIEKASWSPDGEKIVYLLSSFIALDLIKDEIIITNTDGSGSKNLISDLRGKTNLSWSPDSKKILLEISIEERVYFESLVVPPYNTLWTIDIDNSEQKLLLKNGETIENSSWSPSSDKIVFESSNNIWIINSDGTDKKQITNATSDIWYRNPSWSPDGKKIVYVSIITGEVPINEIWIMDSGGDNKKQLIRYEGIIEKPVWSPDGKKIAYIKNGEIWVISPK